jgi:hypothetical protein
MAVLSLTYSDRRFAWGAEKVAKIAKSKPLATFIFDTPEGKEYSSAAGEAEPKSWLPFAYVIKVTGRTG